MHKYRTRLQRDHYSNGPVRKQRKEVRGAFGEERSEADNWAGPWKMKRTTTRMDEREGRPEFGGINMKGLFRKCRVSWCSASEENFRWDEAHCIQDPKRRQRGSSLVDKGKRKVLGCSMIQVMHIDSFLSVQCPFFCLLKMTTWFSLGKNPSWNFCSCDLGGMNQLTSYLHSFSRVVRGSTPGEGAYSICLIVRDWWCYLR